jgi:DNA primase
MDFLYAAGQAARVPVDTAAIKERIDLTELIGRDTRLKRVASTRGGEYAGPCPFCGGRDRLRVQPARRRWWCRSCLAGERWQDAIAYVQRRDGLGDDLAEACRRLGASPSELRGPLRTRSRAAVAVALAVGLRRASELDVAEDLEPPEVWRERGLQFVAECETTLWSAAGERARAYLRRRGLHEATLRVWRVGFQPTERRFELAERWGLPPHTSAGRRTLVWLPRGIVLPWLADGKLWHLKVRTAAADPNERYRAVRGGHPWLYGSDSVQPERPVLLVEAELCALLIWQEAHDLLSTASLGGCNRTLTERALGRLTACPTQLLAHDADVEGEKGADRLERRLPHAHRIRPPFGKDPTEYAHAGGCVRDWLHAELDRLQSQASPGGVQ